MIEFILKVSDFSLTILFGAVVTLWTILAFEIVQLFVNVSAIIWPTIPSHKTLKSLQRNLWQPQVDVIFLSVSSTSFLMPLPS